MSVMTNSPAAVGVPEIETRHRMAIALDYAGIKKGNMAGLLEVSGETIGNYLSGRSRPSPVTLREWARITGVSIEWLRWGTTPIDGGDGPGLRVPPTACNYVPAGRMVALRTRRVLAAA